MTGETYKKISSPFYKNPWLMKLLLALGKILPFIGAASYFILLTLCILNSETQYFMKSVFIPGFGFFLVTLVRKRINAPRPYEDYDIKPLIKRDKNGCSFPSRHVYSMSVIAAVWLGICVPFAVFLIILSIILAIIRVLCAVHYPRDVIAGFIIGSFFGIIAIQI